MNLVIVESPSKASTIEKILGEDYKVMSSVGHIRDLAISGKGGLGVDVENDFKPSYSKIRGKAKIIKELKKVAAEADIVYLATDPDREGEAISWHIFDCLELSEDKTVRVVFNEITKTAILNGIKNSRSIDMGLVSSQETRRILDRIIGFKLSNLLQRKIGSKSAGRVQSVALKLLVDLEKEIIKFVPEEYWELKADFQGIIAELEKYKGKKIEIKTAEEMDVVLNALTTNYSISDIVRKVRKRNSLPPFITSTLQQASSNKFNYGAKKTMIVAQKLYEGIQIGKESVGLITYMRTDSTRMSDEFISGAKELIIREYGKDYYKGYFSKKGKNSQDAHEAIRPTNAMRTPESIKNYLKVDEYKVYKLIYDRAVASTMADAKFDDTKVEIINGDYLFIIEGKKLKFDGYTKVYDYDLTKDKLLPTYSVNQVLALDKLLPEQKFTKPKSRFTEAKLIKKLEEVGVGRPSTYAQTMDTLKARNYVKIEEKKFYPSEQGVLTIEKLDQYFNSIVNVNYTAKMEEDLDKISAGEEESVKIIGDFYYQFIPLVDQAKEKMESIPPKKVGRNCPECESDLVLRNGRYGEFVACSNYPECKFIEKDEKLKPVTLGVKCPKCDKGEIVERVATRGRSKGNKFYACNNFPKCKNILNGKPIKEICPECGELLVEVKEGIICNNKKECKYQK